MENLSKHQIVLLTLLVSFITSIATGIVTVALMNQAPIGLSQTINRVVERTIEQVVATSTPSSKDSGQTTTKETIVVSEDDQVVSAINNNAKSIVRIYEKNVDPATGLAENDFVALGIAVTDDGIIATDNGVIFSSGNYFIQGDDGTPYGLSVLEADASQPVALLKVTATSTPAIPKANLASQDLQLGQAIVYVGGESKNTVATGIVSTFGTKNISSGQSSSTISSIPSPAGATSTPPAAVPQIVSVETSIPQDSLIPGGILLDLSGDLVGIKSAYAAGDDLFAPASAIQTAIASIQVK